MEDKTVKSKSTWLTIKCATFSSELYLLPTIRVDYYLYRKCKYKNIVIDLIFYKYYIEFNLDWGLYER